MLYQIHANSIISISELKRNPKEAMSNEPVAVLNHNKPIYYCIPPLLYEAMLDIIDDIELIRLVKEREGEESLEVELSDL